MTKSTLGKIKDTVYQTVLSLEMILEQEAEWEARKPYGRTRIDCRWSCPLKPSDRWLLRICRNWPPPYESRSGSVWRSPAGTLAGLKAWSRMAEMMERSSMQSGSSPRMRMLNTASRPFRRHLINAGRAQARAMQSADPLEWRVPGGIAHLSRMKKQDRTARWLAVRPTYADGHRVLAESYSHYLD
ncbi:MAG: hypothetical protein HC841_00485 [Verrucomicrobiae bacterium]|nr:hypothetical protein [Verrucomicrobiae bacterium]